MVFRSMAYKVFVCGFLFLCSGITVASVDALPRAEHPRPDFYRDCWLNLNGTWQFEIDDNADGLHRGLNSGMDLKDKIVVPFCPESTLSGVGNTHFMKHVWYRRFFGVPETMKGKRILLHFGAVDYCATVWVNGVKVGLHQGGSTPFVFDITDEVQGKKNELVVYVVDDIHSGQPSGKQGHSLKSSGCVYTRTTGIWQTVWLEGVGRSYISSFHVVPDPDHSRIIIQAEVSGPCNGLKVVAKAIADGKDVGSESCDAAWRNNYLILNLSKKRLWSIEDPFLYDLELSLQRDGQAVDTVKSYFGLRTVTIEGRAILINGKPVFQRTILDQGFYPDGIWTAPSDAALKKDIELSMAAGFNGARLHQKVFEPRFLYWADKLGYLVWGEFDDWGMTYSGAFDSAIIREWGDILRRDRSHPAIIGWCPFNETQTANGNLQRTILTVTRMMDPSRPVLEVSGGAHTTDTPDLLDKHHYTGDVDNLNEQMSFVISSELKLPKRYGMDRVKNVPFFCSEYGGRGIEPRSETVYVHGDTPKTIEDFYKEYKLLTDAQLDNRYVFGFCYTQLTDVEQEKNGLYTYDRRPKFDMKRIHDITARKAAYELNPPTEPVAEKDIDWTVLVGAEPDGALARPWKYSTDKPGNGWTKPNFDDSQWPLGLGPFGDKNSPVKVNTLWKGDQLYLRKQFNFKDNDFQVIALVMMTDGKTRVELNGRRLWDVGNWTNKPYRWNQRYAIFDVTRRAKELLKSGTNTLTVEIQQRPDDDHTCDLGLLGGK